MSCVFFHCVPTIYNKVKALFKHHFKSQWTNKHHYFPSDEQMLKCYQQTMVVCLHTGHCQLHTYIHHLGLSNTVYARWAHRPLSMSCSSAYYTSRHRQSCGFREPCWQKNSRASKPIWIGWPSNFIIIENRGLTDMLSVMGKTKKNWQSLIANVKNQIVDICASHACLCRTVGREGKGKTAIPIKSWISIQRWRHVKAVTMILSKDRFF